MNLTLVLGPQVFSKEFQKKYSDPFKKTAATHWIESKITHKILDIYFKKRWRLRRSNTNDKFHKKSQILGFVPVAKFLKTFHFNIFVEMFAPDGAETP